MVPIFTSVLVTRNTGLGDWRGCRKDNDRRVTIMSLEQWEAACSDAGITLPWHMRRAGLCVSGIRFDERFVGRQIGIGKDLLLEVTMETEPCERMDEIHQGLRAALANWRGGVSCKVLRGGEISPGDSVYTNF